MTPEYKTQILFVCMGNICRSPLAECVFVAETQLRGLADQFEVDSAGTGGWHEGQDPDKRMRKAAQSQGIDLRGSARQVCRRDFSKFEYIVCMDQENREALLAMGAPREKISLLLEYDNSLAEQEVPDPYYGGEDGFHRVIELVSSACGQLLDHLQESVEKHRDG